MEKVKLQLDEFKKVVIKNSTNPLFAYKEWFIKDHLMIVEKIAMELCDNYTNADRDVVFALVWFHDFGKPIDEKNERNITKTVGLDTMQKIGFQQDFIDKVFLYWTRMEMKNEIDISKEPIEVQIVSSADGASHFVGKFFSTYFSDSQSESFKDIESRIKQKIQQDWERKISLPEVKKSFQERYEHANEIAGMYPEFFVK